ncbi:hypothetical protein K435DRAFT_798780 [Dendrothele bispora CBS 962.96]|uniref:F-box domain-containing protein n=1 Tax=Dendrothele bispora (strain CBS 962.96) TaxID=1314807 RepID=A0A4S8LXZ8_DENBC|nr:hypothetical protein K435DRAFT_798780 [Dendrothele bispora CBS 962.96]
MSSSSSSPSASSMSVPHDLMNSNTAPLQDELDSMRSSLSHAETRLSSIREQIVFTRNSLVQLECEEQKLIKYIADQRTVLNPVRRLPPDILFELFTACLDSTPVLDLRSSRLTEDSLDIKSPRWVLGHVCSVWRSVVLSSPSLWSNIKLSITKKNSTFSSRTLLLGLHLQRTQQRPLSVSLYGGYNSLNESHPFLVLLLPTAPRWNALFVAMKTGHISQCLEPAKPFLERLNTLSLLPRSIHETVTTPAEPVGGAGGPGNGTAGPAAAGGLGPGTLTFPDAKRGIPDVFSTAPLLRKLQVFHDPTHISIPWSRLTFLRLCPAVCRNVKVVGILREMKALEELIIGCNLLQEELDFGFGFGWGMGGMVSGSGLTRSRSGSSTPSAGSGSFSITLPSLRKVVLQSYQPRNSKNRRGEQRDHHRGNNPNQNHHHLLISSASTLSSSLSTSTSSPSSSHLLAPSNASSHATTSSSFNHSHMSMPNTPTALSPDNNEPTFSGETGGASQLLSVLLLPKLESFTDYSKSDVPDWPCLRDVFSRGAVKAHNLQKEEAGGSSSSNPVLPATVFTFPPGWTLTNLTTSTPTSEEDFLVLLRSAPALERVELRCMKGLGNVGVWEMAVPGTTSASGSDGELGEGSTLPSSTTSTSTITVPSKETPILVPNLRTLILHGDLSFDAKVFVDMVESRWVAAGAVVANTSAPSPRHQHHHQHRHRSSPTGVGRREARGENWMNRAGDDWWELVLEENYHHRRSWRAEKGRRVMGLVYVHAFPVLFILNDAF